MPEHEKTEKTPNCEEDTSENDVDEYDFEMIGRRFALRNQRLQQKCLDQVKIGIPVEIGGGQRQFFIPEHFLYKDANVYACR